MAEKSYISIDDLSHAIDLVSRASGVSGIYNVGPERPIAVRQVVADIAMLMGKSFNEICEVAPERDHQDAKYHISSEKIRKAVGWAPRVDWLAGLRKMIEWVTDNFDELKDLPTEFSMRD